ncbi:DUF427 domain-containing protein [Catellatospora coxensis]
MWRGAVLADGEDTVRAGGVVYFAAADVAWQYLRPSTRRTVCPWKGVATYFTIVVGEVADRDAAWAYRRPWASGRRLSGRVGFGGGVEIVTSRATR